MIQIKKQSLKFLGKYTVAYYLHTALTAMISGILTWKDFKNISDSSMPPNPKRSGCQNSA